MKSYGIRKDSFIDSNDLEKELLLNEMEISVQRYIKTGVKNQQLEELLDLEEEFQTQFTHRFYAGDIAKRISESSKQRFLEQHYLLEICKDSGGQPTEKNNAQLIKKNCDKIFDVLEKNLEEYLSEVLKDAAYLSHMNQLYELYEREKQLRQQEKEFEKVHEKFKELSEITKLLSKQKRMEIEEIEKEINVSQERFILVMNQCDKYFNVKEQGKKLKVSLSPYGRKYNDFIENDSRKFSVESLNQLVFKNCNNIMNSLKKSLNLGYAVELKLDGVLPRHERVIKNRYYDAFYTIMEDSEDGYKIRLNYLNGEKVSENNEYEKDRFRIPAGWNEENY
ncbi:MAG: hypothetical protein J6B50_12755 [Lachnospiraceae bacterium]|nr:hypothetical protein [Lachnospiraceae bacterium]